MTLPPRPPRHHLARALLAALLLALPAASCKRRQPDAGPSDASANAAETRLLASIWDEPSATRRLHRLTLWAQTRTPAQIAAAFYQTPKKHRHSILMLLSLKLRDQNPGADPETLGNKLGSLILENAPPADAANEIADWRRDSASQLRNDLFKLAKTDPSAALARLAATRLHPNTRSEIAAEILAHLAATSPRQALALLDTSPGDRRDALIAMTKAWVRHDPAAAIAHVDALPRSKLNNELRDLLLQTWSDTDPGAAAEAIASLPVTRENRYLFRQIIANWLKDSPDESVRWLQSQTAPDPLVVQAAIEALADTHPALAARLLGNPGLDEHHARRIAAAWAQTDPAAAIAWLKSQPLNPSVLGAMETCAAALARKDLPAALALLQNLPGDARADLIAAAIAPAIQPPEKALQWLLAQPDSPVTRDAIFDTLDRASPGSPKDMLALLGQLPPGPLRTSIHNQLARLWFAQNPADAVRWATGLQDPAALHAVLEGSIDAWASHDPASLANLLASAIGKDKRLADDASRLVDRWHRADPFAAADWIIQNPDIKIRGNDIRETFGACARHNPAALDRLLADIPTGKLHATALGGAISRAVEANPALATQLLDTHATPAERPDLIDQLTSRWVRADPDAAIAWTSSLPPGKARDRGLLQLLDIPDPHRALALAALGSTPKERENMTASAISHWHRHDAAAALAAIDQAPLPPPRREQLRAALLAR
ncbi:hypothetical protein OpiT1DRAFT_01963 [Opitutaceae bacterium TAV1]|nr:hypothetical protein OpiT1DRAFT_01963 [Opitutaceae bacterium TAV1]